MKFSLGLNNGEEKIPLIIMGKGLLTAKVGWLGHKKSKRDQRFFAL